MEKPNFGEEEVDSWVLYCSFSLQISNDAKVALR